MLQNIRKLLERNALILAIAATLFLGVMSLVHMPKISLEFGIKSGDKYLHFTAYMVLSFLWYFALRERIQNRLFKFFVPLSLILYGIVLEGLQGELTTYRTPDLSDAMANTGGVIAGLFIFNRFFKWYRTI